MSSRGLPDVLMNKVDEYVDSLAPQIQPRITSELEVFQQKTIDSLESQVVDAFRSLFNKDKDGGTSRSLNDAAPDSYGSQSLPFADEIAKLTRSFSTITDEASDDLRDIFDLTQGRNGTGETRSRGGDDNSSGGARGFFSAAIDAVQDHLDNNNNNSNKGGGQSFELGGLLGVLSDTVKDASRNPEEKARLISPEIKEQVGAKLRQQHAPIAEQFTRIALDHIKRWLRGNTTSRDLGDGVKGEIEDQVKDLVKGIGGLFGSKKQSNEGSARGFGDRDGEGNDGESGGGFSKVISDKLSTGLAKVHREVRLEFRKVLGAIEKQLFELLPDAFQRPLEKILGGNPFDSQLDRDAAPQADRGFGDDIKAKLVNKIRDLVRKVQETLREGILGVVNGGHRKFERQSWTFVQTMVEERVHKYLPKVKISVPDDIGNEGVSVGAPTSSAYLGGANQPVPTSQGGNSQQQHGQGYNGLSGSQHQQDYRPDHQQQNQDYRPQQQNQDYRPQQQTQDYRPQQHQSGQDYRPQQSQPHQEYRPDQYQPTQQYGSQHRPEQPQAYEQNQGYQENQGYQQNQVYQQSQGHRQNQDYRENQDYQSHDRRHEGGYQQNGGRGQNQGYQREDDYRQNQQHGHNPSY